MFGCEKVEICLITAYLHQVMDLVEVNVVADGLPGLEGVCKDAGLVEREVAPRESCR